MSLFWLLKNVNLVRYSYNRFDSRSSYFYRPVYADFKFISNMGKRPYDGWSCRDRDDSRSYGDFNEFQLYNVSFHYLVVLGASMLYPRMPSKSGRRKEISRISLNKLFVLYTSILLIICPCNNTGRNFTLFKLYWFCALWIKFPVISNT